ncbi:MAG: DNA mismatch repair endonuclease MutL [Candidatus Peregrinibacteria bacterium]
MSSIHLLPENLRNQIAAGEVVERPASVVKELVENAIDAGGTHIEIRIQEGGREKIEVQDNGKGMDEEDAKMCFFRYATSKISTTDDLFALHSFGFRGEAIAAISSVSRMTITTKTEKMPAGIAVSGEEKNLSTKAVGCQTGTTVTVEDLFWNVPARRKFLKSEAIEWREIAKILESFTLSHPEISFRVEKDGKTVMDFPSSSVPLAPLVRGVPEGRGVGMPKIGDKNEVSINTNLPLQNRIASLFGHEFADSLLPLRYDGAEIQISGFCSHPHNHRGTKDRQFLWVNKRSITNDKNIDTAVYRAYESLIPKGRKPSFFLSLTIHPELVDMNVHPRKSEVRFLHPLYEVVKGAFDHALNGEYQAFSEKYAIGGEKWREIEGNSITGGHDPLLVNAPLIRNSIPLDTFAKGAPLARPYDNPPKVPNFSFPTLTLRDLDPSPLGSIFPLKRKVIGQIRKSFLVMEEEDGILIIDQHAVHERVRYEELMRQVHEKKIASQELLTPMVITVSPSEKALLLSEQEDLELLGFSIAEFGDREIAVSAVPSGTGERAVEELLRDILEDLSSPHPKDGRETKKTLERIATYASCRGAIKFGDALTLPEMESLVEKWEACGRGFSCAHGRPVYKKILFTDLEHDHGR